MTDPDLDHRQPPPAGLTGGKHLSLGRRIVFWFRRIPRRLTRIPDSPHEIAKAFAVGVFIGILPGMGALWALLAAIVFRLSKAATILGTLTTNPWTVAPIYIASYRVGKWLLQYETAIDWKVLYQFNTGWTQELGKAFPPVVLGGLVLGLIVAIASYGIVYFLLSRYKRVRMKRLHA